MLIYIGGNGHKRCVFAQFAFFLLRSCYSRETMHLRIIMCDMIVFDIDIVLNAFLDMPIWSWYILIYTHVLHLAKTLCQYAPLFQYFEIFIKHIYMRKRNSHLHSLLLLLNISFVYIRQSAYFWTVSDIFTTCHMQKL